MTLTTTTFVSVDGVMQGIGGPGEDRSGAGRSSGFWAFLVTGVAIFMVSLDNLVVTTALPAIRAGLGAGLEGLEWTVNAYTLTFAVFLLTGAALGDRFGRRRMLLVGLSLFTGPARPLRWLPTSGC